MQINFFEEYPNEKNLTKIKLIKFKSTIYLAAKSLKEFETYKNKIIKNNPEIEVAYWPILEKSYWISPFSYTSELKQLYDELYNHNKQNKHDKNNKNKKPLKILLDLELPFLNKKLFYINLFSFKKNKKIIKKIFTNAKKLNIKILTAEYPSPNKIIEKKLQWLGVSYSIKKQPHKKIIMFYTSMIKNKYVLKKIKKHIEKQSKKLKENLQLGLGTIATGAFGNEPKLTPKKLDEDLSFAKEQKIKTIIIFRLEGLNKKYIKIITKHINN